MAASNSKPLTLERLKQLLHFDAETGVFRWRSVLPNMIRILDRPAGYVAGDGYLRIGVDGRYYKGANLAWFYVHGKWPESKLDHKNRNRADNRIDNLRPATNSQNHVNLLSPKQTLRSRGVWLNKHQGNYGAAVWKDGERIYLGRFPTEQLAALAYDEAAIKIHGEFAVLNYPERSKAPA